MTAHRLPSLVRRSRTMLAAAALLAAWVAVAAMPVAAGHAAPAASEAAYA